MSARAFSADMSNLVPFPECSEHAPQHVLLGINGVEAGLYPLRRKSQQSLNGVSCVRRRIHALKLEAGMRAA